MISTKIRSFSRQASSAVMGAVYQQIEQKLVREFSPVHLEILNESFMHNVPKGSETHFKLIIVSPKFESLNMLARHRAVQKLLAEEFSRGLHALSLNTFTPEQWEQQRPISPSPKCMGGSKL
eukprot:Sdes_comp18024_c0_seq1m7335